MPVLLVKIAVAEPLPLRLGQEVSVFVGSEPPPLAHQHTAAPDTSSLADPAAALLLDPVSREAVSAALTTIFGTLFFVMLRRRLASGFGSDEDENRGETATADAQQEEEEGHEEDSETGALDGLSEEDVIVLDDSDEDEAPRLVSSGRLSRRT
jgi:hypothetical protein